MQRRDFLKLAAVSTASAALAPGAPARRRPNIVWLTCEDMSPHLGCYGVVTAHTPHLDMLAAQGRRYTQAFSVSGVCAPSRSCLITGRYPASLGTHHMRCKRQLPPDFRCFPHYLRQAGYYCTNNVKTDYNFDAPEDTWDESSNRAHWKHRREPEQPFFAVFNHTGTHESSIGRLLEEGDSRGTPRVRHDPNALELPPYYPDTPLIRQHWAHYFDLISLMDDWVGERVRELDEAGLMENTVVFFYSDHGAGLPRAKRWLYDSGLHVPLLVRWPGVLAPGSVTDQLVSFVDFGPTALSIAGVATPEDMQGRPFLGEHRQPPREYVFGARDRMDERYDIIRAARDKRYKYLRNYAPHRAYDQRNEYNEGWPVMQEMRRVQAAGALTPEQALFFRQTKPLEELYDLDRDPHELNNLAEDLLAAADLARLRKAMDTWRAEVRDLGLVPEMVLEAWLDAVPAPVRTAYEGPENAPASAFGRTLGEWVHLLNTGDAYQRLDAIRGIGCCGDAAQSILLATLADPQETVVYWAAAALGEGEEAPEVLEALEALREAPAACVRLSALRALCRLGHEQQALPGLLRALEDPDPLVRLHVVETLEPLAGHAAVREALTRALEDPDGYVSRIARCALGQPAVRR